MPLLVFTDTTSLINLHLVGRLDILRGVAHGNARWTRTLRRECMRLEARSAEDEDLPSLDGLTEAVDAVLGEPLAPDDNEHRSIRELRQRMAGPQEHRDKHLGEAEVLTVVQMRRLDAVFVTDDGAVKGFAEGSPVCINTWELLRAAKGLHIIDEPEIRRMRAVLLGHRRVRLHDVRDPASFEAWLRG